MRLSDIKLGYSSRETNPLLKSRLLVIPTAGGKGGTGRTNIAVNLAQVLANNGKRTLILDADLGMANDAVLPGLEPEHTLYDVMR
jgi:flagellar biosynthesis protein FlhG